MKAGICSQLYSVKFSAKSNQMEPRTVVFSERGDKNYPVKICKKICGAYVRQLSKQKDAEFSAPTSTSKTLGLGHFLAIFCQNI